MRTSGTITQLIQDTNPTAMSLGEVISNDGNDVYTVLVDGHSKKVRSGVAQTLAPGYKVVVGDTADGPYIIGLSNGLSRSPVTINISL